MNGICSLRYWTWQQWFASHQYREQNEDRSRVSTRNSSGPVPGQGLMPFSDMQRTCFFCGDVWLLYIVYIYIYTCCIIWCYIIVDFMIWSRVARDMLEMYRFLMFQDLIDFLHYSIERTSRGATVQPIRSCTKSEVYKTSILVFKDRARYVEGEFRFRQDRTLTVHLSHGIPSLQPCSARAFRLWRWKHSRANSTCVRDTAREILERW